MPVFCGFFAGTAIAQTDPQAAWEKRYKAWQEEQARLDDGFLFSVAVGPSPTYIGVRLTGTEDPEFSSAPPYDQLSFRGIGAMVDLRMGWLLKNDPYLKDLWYGNTPLHDQLYLTWNLITRTSPSPQLRFVENESANQAGFFQPKIIVDVMTGIGMSYVVYPYLTSFSATLGIGFLGMQDTRQSVRTNIGPAANLRVGQEWKMRENWRTGFAVSYGYVRSVNPPRQYLNQNNALVYSYRETYSSHLLAIQWLNSFTPPRYRRGLPPARPR